MNGLKNAISKFTKREKVLIYGLLVIGLVMGGIYLLVIPSYEKYQSLDTQLSETEFKEVEMRMAIEGVPSTITQKEAATAKLGELKAGFQAHLPNEGLDLLLGQLCLYYSLSPESLSISQNAWQEVPPFVEAPLVYSVTPGAEDEKTQESTEKVTGGSTWLGAVTMEVVGTEHSFENLLDAVKGRKDMSIVEFSIAPNAEIKDSETKTGNETTTVTHSGLVPKLEGNSEIRGTITFNVYMVDK